MSINYEPCSDPQPPNLGGSGLRAQGSGLRSDLVVEQADASEGHGDVVLVTGHDDMVVADGATGLGDVLDPTLVGTLDIVAEGEEGVGAEGYAGVLGNPGALLFQGQHGGLLGEELLPDSSSEI